MSLYDKLKGSPSTNNNGMIGEYNSLGQPVTQAPNGIVPEPGGYSQRPPYLEQRTIIIPANGFITDNIDIKPDYWYITTSTPNVVVQANPAPNPASPTQFSFYQGLYIKLPALNRFITFINPNHISVSVNYWAVVNYDIRADGSGTYPVSISQSPSFGDGGNSIAANTPSYTSIMDTGAITGYNFYKIVSVQYMIDDTTTAGQVQSFATILVNGSHIAITNAFSSLAGSVSYGFQDAIVLNVTFQGPIELNVWAINNDTVTRNVQTKWVIIGSNTYIS